LAFIIPLKGKAGTINSGSSQDAPSMAHLSFNDDATELAEMLVHEGSHQYFYLATRIGPVDDGSDSTMYYSPIKARGRPLHYILLAYHAFANVELFYRDCLAGGYEGVNGYVVRNSATLRAQLDQLEDVLAATTALTPLGEGLWQPLAKRLGES
jgi:HEXXH motif-containing protein